MDAKQLGNILKDMYDNAPRGEQVTQIHVFGIKYATEILKRRIKIKEIVAESGIKSTYVTEVSKGLNLAEYVTLKSN
jgi:hypothetical protein